MTIRSQEQILKRMIQIAPDDMFGFRTEVLICALDWDHVKDFLKPGVTQAGWENDATDTEAKITSEAKSYLEFAWGKARDHRGLSANRSIDKLTEYLWLLGHVETLAAMDRAPFAQYGAPKLALVAASLGTEIPEGDDLARMIKGEPCEPYCQEGCC